MEIRMAVVKFFKTFPNTEPSTLYGMSVDDMKLKMYFLGQPLGKRCLVNAH
jgi:hypothetical protein